MSIETVTPVDSGQNRFLQWTPVFAGAIGAAAFSFILLTFAITIGLGVSSTSPTWRDASAALAILSGIYLILQAIVGFGIGGYIAGRARTRSVDASTDEVENSRRASWSRSLGLGRSARRRTGRPDRSFCPQSLVTAWTESKRHGRRTALELRTRSAVSLSPTTAQRGHQLGAGRGRANIANLVEPLRRKQRRSQLSRPAGRLDDGPHAGRVGAACRHSYWRIPRQPSRDHAVVR